MTIRNDLLTTEEAAAHVGVSPRTLERYRVTGAGPRFLKVGRKVLYRLADLDAWLESRVRRSTSDPGPHGGGGSVSSSERRPSTNARAMPAI